MCSVGVYKVYSERVPPASSVKKAVRMAVCSHGRMRKQMGLVSRGSQAPSTGILIMLFSWNSKLDLQGRAHSLDAMPGTRGSYPTSPSDGMLRCPSLSELYPQPAIVYWVLCTAYSLIDVAGRVENRSHCAALRLREDWGRKEGIVHCSRWT